MNGTDCGILKELSYNNVGVRQMQTADLQTCRLADSTYWPFPIHFKNSIV